MFDSLITLQFNRKTLGGCKKNEWMKVLWNRHCKKPKTILGAHWNYFTEKKFMSSACSTSFYVGVPHSLPVIWITHPLNIKYCCYSVQHNLCYGRLTSSVLRFVFSIKLRLLICGFILNWKTIWIISLSNFHERFFFNMASFYGLYV